MNMENEQSGLNHLYNIAPKQKQCANPKCARFMGDDYDEDDKICIFCANAMGLDTKGNPLKDEQEVAKAKAKAKKDSNVPTGMVVSNGVEG